MTAEWSRIFLKVILVLDLAQKSILDPEPDFSIFRPPCFFSFRPKLTFSITKFKIHPVEYVHNDHTDHFGFR